MNKIICGDCLIELGKIPDASVKDDLILDPFAGSGTSIQSARELGRKYIGIEINPEYIKLIEKRLEQGVFNG